MSATDLQTGRTEESTARQRKEPTYVEIVWEQFRKNRIAFAALWLFVGLFAVAVVAPAVSLDQPFVVTWQSTGETCQLDGACGENQVCSANTCVGKTELPWLENLLLNRNVFEKGVDLFFNLLLVFIPLGVLAYLGFRFSARRRVPPRVWRRRRRRFALGFVVVLLASFAILLFAEPRRALPDWKAEAEAGHLEGAVFPPLDYSYTETSYAINRPSSAEHILGTDSSGRDLFVRMIYGTRISLTIGVIAVSIYVFIGVMLGSLAGYLGGRTDTVILRVIEVFMCFPSFVLILTFVSFLPNRSIFWIMLFIGITRWTTVARLVRGEFLKLKQSDFVQAAIAGGLKTRGVIFRHVLPNAMGPVLVAATFGVANAILIEATLSFLGVSDLEAPSWGRILAVGRTQHDFYTMLLPGLAIFFTVSILNLMGEGLRDALDPKLRK